MEEANAFFWDYPGDHRNFKISENKKRKIDARRRLMNACGGTGKHHEIPPDEYFPKEIIKDELKCNI